MGISEKHIEDLKGLKFNVPSYQRGYRWTSHEVKTLLDDLYNHNRKYSRKRKDKETSCCCLLPCFYRNRRTKF